MILPNHLNELTLLPRWVVYRLVDNNSKLPFDPINHIPAKTNDSNTWTTFEIANNTLANHTYDGLGFVLGNGYVGIDLDDCIDKNNEINSFARKIVHIFNSYTEYSPSNHGLHILCKSTYNKPISIKKDNIEVYNCNRFFTITGNIYLDMPICYRDVEIKYILS